MDIIAITVSVNYADILTHMLHNNAQFFRIWFIVVDPADAKTVELIEKSGLKNVEILLYTGFQKNGAIFNKGGAINYAQTYIENIYTDANILLIDSDIYLPDDFSKKLPAYLEKNTLYGTTARIDYWSVNDFVTNKNPHKYAQGNDFVGFFQLYKQDNLRKYPSSYNCSGCDDYFRETFPKRVRLNISVRHLGRDRVNWNGRAG
jgi:hypothetical protein